MKLTYSPPPAPYEWDRRDPDYDDSLEYPDQPLWRVVFVSLITLLCLCGGAIIYLEMQPR